MLDWLRHARAKRTSDSLASAPLTDGRTIQVMVLVDHATGPQHVAVQIVRDGVVNAEQHLPYPSAGLAGAEIVTSASEDLAVVQMYSGQSEEGYELFNLRNGLTRMSQLDYEYGEAASFCFSADESVLVMALPLTCTEWWSLIFEEGSANHNDGSIDFDFGVVSWHDIAHNKRSRHTLRVNVPATWHARHESYDPLLRPHLDADKHLLLSMPWGEVQVPIPLAPILELAIKHDRNTPDRPGAA